MKVYKNTNGDCSGLAVANAINAQFGVTIPQEEVEALYERHDWDIRGARLQDLLTVLKFEDDLGGYKVKDFKLRFFNGSSKNPAKEVRSALQHPSTSVLLSLWIRKTPQGQRKLKLDDQFFLQPHTGKKVSTHGVYVSHFDFLEDKHVPVGVGVLNNWGRQWGLSGSFFMKFEQFQTECCQLFEVEFEKAH